MKQLKGSPEEPSSTAATVELPSRGSTGSLPVRCPNCRTLVDVSTKESLVEVQCSSCGSTFDLAGEETLAKEHPGAESVPLRALAQFELRERLGAGAFGTVWKAFDTQLERSVAIKIPRGGFDSQTLEGFLREARSAAQVRHPNIVAVHEVGREGDTVYIVSDFIAGLPLDKWLAAHRPAPREAARLCAEIATALDCAHRAGVIHRDLKPSNILMDPAGRPHIMDFGLAKRQTEKVTVTVEGQILGTPAYMSPEQARGQSQLADARTDVYALGVMLFEMLVGHRPFQGDLQALLRQVTEDEPPRPRRLNSRVPRDLETICLKCLEKDPRRRYHSAQDVADELARYQQGAPLVARPVGPLDRGWRWARRRPALAAALCLALVVLVALIAFPTALAIQANRNASVLGQKKTEAENALQLANKNRAERDRVDRERVENLRRSAQLAMFRGVELGKEGDAARGLLWLSSALQLAPPEDQPLRWQIRAEISTWYRQVAELREIIPKAKDFAPTADGGFAVLVPKRMRELTPNEQVRLVSGEQIHYDSSGQRWLLQNYLSVRCGKLPAREVEAPALGISTTRDGKRLLVSGEPSRFWNWERLAPEGASIPGRGTLSPDGRLLCSINGASGLALWNTATGERACPPFAPTNRPGSNVLIEVRDTEFSRDGNLLAVGTTDDTVWLWDTRTGTQVGGVKELRGSVEAVALSPDGRLLAAGTGGADELRTGWLGLWNITDGKQLCAPISVAPPIEQLTFSSDGEILVTAGRGVAQLWHVPRQDLNAPPLVFEGEQHAVAYSPRGHVVLTSGKQGGRLWDAMTGRRRSQPLGSIPPDRVGFNVDGALAATLDFEALRIWNVALEKAQGIVLRHGAFLRPPNDGVSDAAISPDGEIVVSATSEGPVFWNAQTGDLLVPHSRRPPCTRVLFLPGGDEVATGSGSAVNFWDVRTGEPRGAPIPLLRSVRELALVPDGKHLLIRTEDDWNAPSPRYQELHAWNLKTRQPAWPAKKYLNYVFVWPRPDGQALFVWNMESGAQFLNPESGEVLGPGLKLPAGYLNSSAFSPDSRRLVTETALAGKPPTYVCQLWNVQTNELLAEVERSTYSLGGMSFTPDSRQFTLVRSTTDGYQMRLYNALDGRRHGTANHRASNPSFGPRDPRLLSSVEDGLQFWQLRDELVPSAFLPIRIRESGMIVSPKWTPDGKKVLVGVFDHRLHILEAPEMVPDEPDRIARWVEVLTGLELDATGQIQAIDRADWIDRQQTLARLGGAPIKPGYEEARAAPVASVPREEIFYSRVSSAPRFIPAPAIIDPPAKP